MNLREEILREHSKENCTRIVTWVHDDASRFQQLFDLFLTDEYRVVQRAAWPLSYCAIAHPEFISKNFRRMLVNLEKPALHDAVKRNTMRILSSINIPSRFEAHVMDLCFRYLEAPLEPVAIKAFSLKILGDFAKRYPEIVPEIKILIADQMDRQTAAFTQKAKKFLREF